MSRTGFAKAGPGVRGFWSWWLGALASWLPIRLRTAFGLAQQRMLLRRDGDELSLSLVIPAPAGAAVKGGQQIEEFGRLPWQAVASGEAALAADGAGPRAADPLAGVLTPRSNDLPRWWLLPAASGLRRQLSLPAAAADRLRDVLAFEIDRQTPFTTDDVYYDARLLGHRGDGQIDAELVVVPRAALESALAELSPALRATLAGVDMSGERPLGGFADQTADSTALGVNLLPDAQRRGRRDPRAFWNLGLLLIAIAAVAAGLWQIRANREAAAEAFEVEAKRRSQQARKVAEEKKQLVDLVEGLRFLQETRAGRPSTVEVLDELSRLLPNTTYLEKVSVEGDKVLIIGLSSEAPGLVQRLQGSKLWHSMTLTGALQPDPSKGKDRFTLSADLSVSKSQSEKGDANVRRNP
ncbi:MAG: general secretion pathway protein GspL [Lysobacteraceae bacterium]|nr:MAG: general secretion pathway protein GspL [Xanthomonadaceae bacterium]